MPDMDSSEVRLLATRLALAPARVMPALLPVANRAGVGMKSTLRSAASGHRRLGGLPRSVSYEVKARGLELSVEAGWLNPSGAGHLENIAVWGTSRTAPFVDITQAAEKEARPFGAFLAREAARALL